MFTNKSINLSLSLLSKNHFGLKPCSLNILIRNKVTFERCPRFVELRCPGCLLAAGNSRRVLATYQSHVDGPCLRHVALRRVCLAVAADKLESELRTFSRQH